MDSEIEAKFIQIDIEDVRGRLRAAGAELSQPMRLMRRNIFHNPHMSAKDGYVRVRDEGNKITITYKQFDDQDSINGVREVETTVANYDAVVAILEQTGLANDSYQETKRETWTLDGVEVVLDVWPWLDPFIEIEGPSEDAVRQVAEALDFDWNDAIFGGVSAVYGQKYPHMGVHAPDIINKQTPIIRFEDPVPDSFMA